MSTENKYMLIRGRGYLAERDDDGNPLALIDLGDTVDGELNLETTYADNDNNCNAISTQDAHVAIGVKGKVKISFKKSAAELLAIALFGKSVTETGGAFSASADTTLPTGIVAGDMWAIPQGKANLSALTIVDSAGTPATLVLGTHYKVDLKAGIITFLNVTGKTQPFKISGTEVAAQVSVAMLNKRTQEFYFIQTGVNTMAEDAAVRIDLYRIGFGPSAKIMLKGAAGPDTYEIEGVLLADANREADAEFGQLGRYRLLE